MPEQRESPYIWVTWLSKLMAGDTSCEWASWFKVRHESRSYRKTPSTFDEAVWRLEHTAQLGRLRERLDASGKTLSVENQNRFALRGETATVGGKPDLIAASDDDTTVYEIKTSQPRVADKVQVITYMYAIPLAFPEYRNTTIDGVVVYKDHEVPVPPDAVTDEFKGELVELIHRLSAATPALRVPSATECGYCEITADDCPDRIESGQPTEGQTTDF